jgi:hypothetical protein
LDLARRLGGGRIPFIVQTGSQDGAAACLTMTLGALGQKATTADIAARVGVEPGAGVDLREAAYRYGLACQEIKLGRGSSEEELEKTRAGVASSSIDDLGFAEHSPSHGTLTSVTTAG